MLPTGRNFFAVDCARCRRRRPGGSDGWPRSGWSKPIGRRHGDWPRAIALSAWGTANMRTGGDDIAQALALIGAARCGRRHPAGSPASRSCRSCELDRPRVDVTLRVSGLFRDAFPTQIDLLDSAVRAVAALDEPDDANPLAANVARRPARARSRRHGRRRRAQRQAGVPRVRLEARRLWRRPAGADRRGRLAGATPISPMPISTGAATPMAAASRATRRADALASGLADVDLVRAHPGQSRARPARLRRLLPVRGRPRGDRADPARPGAARSPITTHSRPEAPLSRPLAQEIARVVRGRAANPKWIAGVMRHGYKGAFEIAATVDYLFGFAAIDRCGREPSFRSAVRRLSGGRARCATSWRRPIRRRCARPPRASPRRSGAASGRRAPTAPPI